MSESKTSKRQTETLSTDLERIRRAFLLHLWLGFMILAPALAHAASLENPSGGLFYSGVGVISGWKCEANGELTVRFNGGEPVPLVYGSERTDVRDAGACASADVGFVAIMNWARLGGGTHTAVAYDDGVEFARGTFQVATLVEGEDFITGISGRFRARDFPDPG